MSVVEKGVCSQICNKISSISSKFNSVYMTLYCLTHIMFTDDRQCGTFSLKPTIIQRWYKTYLKQRLQLRYLPTPRFNCRKRSKRIRSKLTHWLKFPFFTVSSMWVRPPYKIDCREDRRKAITLVFVYVRRWDSQKGRASHLLLYRRSVSDVSVETQKLKYINITLSHLVSD